MILVLHLTKVLYVPFSIGSICHSLTSIIARPVFVSRIKLDVLNFVRTRLLVSPSAEKLLYINIVFYVNNGRLCSFRIKIFMMCNLYLLDVL